MLREQDDVYRQLLVYGRFLSYFRAVEQSCSCILCLECELIFSICYLLTLCNVENV